MGAQIQLNYVRWYMDYPDPNNNLFLVWYSSRASGSRHEYNDPEFDKMVDEAAAITEFDKRMEVYAEAEKRMLEDGAAVYVYYPFGVRLYKPWVQGLPGELRRSARLKIGTSTLPCPRKCILSLTRIGPKLANRMTR